MNEWEDDRTRFERPSYGRREEFERDIRDDERISARSSGDRLRGNGWPRRYGGESDDRYGGDWDRARGRAYLTGSETRYGRSYGEGPGEYRDRHREYGGWRAEGPDYGDYGRASREGRGHHGGERDWWQRTTDEVRAWMGDEEANRRRELDEMRARRNRGPRGYTRSDDRIKEDVSDRLSEGWLDASDIEVQVAAGEVTLNGHVDSRSAKRRAEDLADSVAGVRHVQNNLRVRDPHDTAVSANSATTTPSSATIRPRH